MPPLTGRLHLFNNDLRNLSFRLSMHITPPPRVSSISRPGFSSRARVSVNVKRFRAAIHGALFVPTRNKCIINAAMYATSEINCLSLRKISGIIPQSERTNDHLLKSNIKLFLQNCSPFTI